MQRSWGSVKKTKPALYQQGWIVASFDDFGYFQAYIDTLAPDVRLPGSGDTIDLSASRSIVFTPTDNFGIIRSFRAELNGQWLRFTNDKGRSWIYRFDERCPYGTHQLVVTVEDGVGNQTTDPLSKRNDIVLNENAEKIVRTTPISRSSFHPFITLNHDSSTAGR
jgi:hypothetical protein